MKRFLTYTILFVLPFVCTTISLEIYLRHRPNTYKYKYDWMQNNAEDVEILILGSSHTLNGIHPDYFNKKAFNLANNGQRASQDLYLLKKWKGKYKRLKTIIFPISYFTWFIDEMENMSNNEPFRCMYYKIYMDCDLYSDFSLYNVALCDIPMKIKNGKLKTLFEIQELGCDKHGWGTLDNIGNKNLDTWEKADYMIEWSTAKDKNAMYRNIANIKEIAIFSKKHNIQLILITTPCWHSYYNQLEQKQLNKMYELTHALQKEYGIQYFDYLKDDRFIEEDFYDCSHLSDIGAEKFTKILKTDLGL